MSPLSRAALASAISSAALAVLFPLCAPLLLQPFLPVILMPWGAFQVVQSNVGVESAKVRVACQQLRASSHSSVDVSAHEFGSGLARGEASSASLPISGTVLGSTTTGIGTNSDASVVDVVTKCPVENLAIPSFPTCYGRGFFRRLAILPFGSSWLWPSLDSSTTSSVDRARAMPLPLQCSLTGDLPIWHSILDGSSGFLFFLTTVIIAPFTVAARAARSSAAAASAKRMDKNAEDSETQAKANVTAPLIEISLGNQAECAASTRHQGRRRKESTHCCAAARSSLQSLRSHSWVEVFVAERFSGTLCTLSLCSLWLFFGGDHQRLQPWMIQLPLIIVMGVVATDPRLADGSRGFHCAQLLIAGFYIWAGMRKFSAGFGGSILPLMRAGLLSDHAGITASPAPTEFDVHLLGPALAVLEVVAGVALLLPKRFIRSIAALFFITMHACIIASLISIGTNAVVIIWATCLMFLVAVLFLGGENDVDFSAGRVCGSVLRVAWPSLAPKRARAFLDNFVFLVVFVCLVVPVVGQLGIADGFMSGEMHTGNPALGWLVWQPGNSYAMQDLAKIITRSPEEAAVAQSRFIHAEMVDFSAWSFDALNVPLVAEWRMYAGLSLLLCEKISDEALRTSVFRFVPRRALFDYRADTDRERASQDFTCADLRALVSTT